MRAIHRILVAVKELDGKALPAVLKAAQLARALGASLELFPRADHTHVCRRHQGRPHEACLPSRRMSGGRYCAASRRSRPPSHARHHGCCLCSMGLPGTRKRHSPRTGDQSGPHRGVRSRGPTRMPWLLRLTDWDLVRASPMPVLLVKNPHPYRCSAVLAAVDPGHAHEKPLKARQGNFECRHEVE